MTSASLLISRSFLFRYFHKTSMACPSILKQTNLCLPVFLISSTLVTPYGNKTLCSTNIFINVTPYGNKTICSTNIFTNVTPYGNKTICSTNIFINVTPYGNKTICSTNIFTNVTPYGNKTLYYVISIETSSTKE